MATKESEATSFSPLSSTAALLSLSPKLSLRSKSRSSFEMALSCFSTSEKFSSSSSPRPSTTSPLVLLLLLRPPPPPNQLGTRSRTTSISALRGGHSTSLKSSSASTASPSTPLEDRSRCFRGYFCTVLARASVLACTIVIRE